MVCVGASVLARTCMMSGSQTYFNKTTKLSHERYHHSTALPCFLSTMWTHNKEVVSHCMFYLWNTSTYMY